MASSQPKRSAATSGAWSALRWAVFLLGVYVALHLATGGAIRLITGRDASDVIAPGGSPGPAVAAVSVASQAGKEPAGRAPQRQPERAAERPRECKLGFPFDSDCTME